MPDISPSNARQQPLAHIALREGMRFASWYSVAAHEVLLGQLQGLLEEQGHAQLFLWGEPETGKTHLLEALCAEAWQQGLQAAYLPLGDLFQHGPGVLAGSENQQLLCLDDVGSVLGHDAWERALFNMINVARERGQRLVMSAGGNPRELQCSLKDLQSRLPWGSNFRLPLLADQDKAELLKYRAGQRGFVLSQSVIDYINHRYPRNLKHLIAILDKLDEASLSQHRKITIPLVKEVLG